MLTQFNSEDNYSLNCTHFIPPFLGTINMSKTEKIWLEWRFNYWCIFNLKYLNIGFIIEKLKGVVYDFVYLVELNMFYFLTMLKPLIGKYTPVWIEKRWYCMKGWYNAANWGHSVELDASMITFHIFGALFLFDRRKFNFKLDICKKPKQRQCCHVRKPSTSFTLLTKGAFQF